MTDKIILPRPDEEMFRAVMNAICRRPKTVEWCCWRRPEGTFSTDELWIESVPAWVSAKGISISQPLTGTTYPTLRQRIYLRLAVAAFRWSKPDPYPPMPRGL